MNTAIPPVGDIAINGPFSGSHTVAVSDLEQNKYAASFNGAGSLVISVGMVVDTEVSVMSTVNQDVVISSSGSETFDGDATATLNGAGLVTFKKIGASAWSTVLVVLGAPQ